MKAAIVILNWNGKEHLKKYMPSVVGYTDTSLAEIIVADNGSTDDSVAFLDENYPFIRIIKLDSNYGFAGGYNKALAQIDAEIFCLLNSDVRVTAGWLDKIFKIFSEEDNVGAIQPKILSDRDTSRFEHAGAAGGFIDKYGYPFCRGRIMDVIEKDNGQYDNTIDIFWASGACLFIRADLFRRSGGFDVDFFAHMEEIDLCWRLKNQGYRILFTPESVVYHWGGATLEYNNPYKLFLNFRNSLWTLYKNYTGSNLFWVLFRRMIIDTLAIVKYLFTLDFKNSFAVIRAHLVFHKTKGNIKAKRKELISKVMVKSHDQILGSSIVWQFFGNNKKHFGGLNEFHKS